MNVPSDTTSLPELSDASLDRIEESVFTDIARDRAARRARRSRWWAGGTAAVAVIAIAAVIGPAVTTALSPTAGDSTVIATDLPAVDDRSVGAAESGLAGGDAAVDGADADRDIITTASATVEVADVGAGADAVAAAARERGGWVESLSVSRTEGGPGGAPDISDTSMPAPYPYGGSWVTVRVPSDELEGLLAELSDLGDVQTSSVDRHDVTEQTIDLRARVEATEASVARLSELLDEAQDLSDLIAAESALAERQATLESYRQQLDDLEGRVATSSLTVTLIDPPAPVDADPAGFADGLVAGWNGLVATLNGIVLGLGFLLPWIAVVGVATTVVWLVLRLARRRTRGHRRRSGDADDHAGSARDGA